ncbi:DNA mismatch repair protein MutS [Desulfitispora alkaliphila]|uniref:DNA mismatch repair protein MutS n=1 Tax=Desulfitispora alkaliphila TaxID=622674 RepID=UPI003D262056
MMKQYLEIKSRYKDCILFFRLGDFYEMFFEDAEVASQELQIALTSRDGGKSSKVPMCGVPYHAAKNYIARLVRGGYKIAICEQLTDPKESKGIVERDVVRIITPGTLIEEELLVEDQNNYIMAIVLKNNIFGVAYTDFSTGEFKLTQFADNRENVINEINRIQPVEIIVEKKEELSFIDKANLNINNTVSVLEQEDVNYKKSKEIILEQFKGQSLEAFGCEKEDVAVIAAGSLLEYVNNTQKANIKHIEKISYYTVGDFMTLDYSTRRNLELTTTMKNNQEKGSLFWVLNETVTAMGGRLLRNWLNQPLISISEIEKRQEAVAQLVDENIIREEIRNKLKKVYDLERLISKICIGSGNPQDLIKLKHSISVIRDIKELIAHSSTRALQRAHEEIDPLLDIFQIIDSAVVEEAPSTTAKGEIIKSGYSKEVDELRHISTNGKKWIIDYEHQQRETTGIKSLKIRFNKVFGYYIEVTKSNLALVPDYYQRKQTLANCERYITPELKEYEEKITNAESLLVEKEQKIFGDITGLVGQARARVQKSAYLLAMIDVMANFAHIAIKRNYSMPKINTEGVIKFEDARHPVIEVIEKNSFVPNSIELNDDEFFHIITGPNMAGKSTFARTVALLTLLAQIGSFVPARRANIDIRDRIFARVGAADDLTTGQSTFMVEMNEVANILNNSSDKSLIILDEVGRGTSTFDGLSIAWAITEYIHDSIKAKTIFATHYHELTSLEQQRSGIKNYSVLVKEDKDDVIFLHKIVPGGTDKSYGIHVAKLAGLPKKVLSSAEKILTSLEGNQSAKGEEDIKTKAETKTAEAVEFTNPKSNSQELEAEILEKINELDLINMTPLDAINFLHQLKLSCSSKRGVSSNE